MQLVTLSKCRRERPRDVSFSYRMRVIQMHRSINICLSPPIVFRLDEKMKIEHEQIKRKGIFFIEENGGRVAELFYFKLATGEMNVYRTEVDEQLRGKGVGRRLVAEAVKFARERGMKIVPTCPFVKRVIGEMPDGRN